MTTFLKNKLQENKGLTLIELLMTISLMAILGTFFVPQMFNFNRSQVLKSCSEDLLDFLQVVQNKALSGYQENPSNIRSYGVFYFPDSHVVGVFEKAEVGGNEIWESDAVDYFSVPSEISLSWSSQNPEFSVPTGKFLSGTQTISVCYAHVGLYEITINSTGVISLGSKQDVAECF